MWHKSIMFLLLILLKYTIKNPPVAIGIALPEDFLYYKKICLINILKSGLLSSGAREVLTFIEGFRRANYLGVLYQWFHYFD